MQEKPKNRDWVKNAAIIFLAVLLVLTFFSNTIMNRSLPEVATQEVTSGSIVARVRGTGTVTANSNTQVKMEKTRVIRSVLVKVGQQVEAGDVLFTLGEGSSEDIEAAENTLRNLQANYNRTAVSIPVHSYTTETRKIENLKKEYEAAIEKVKELRDYFEEQIKSKLDDVHIYGDVDNRIPNTSNIAFLTSPLKSSLNVKTHSVALYSPLCTFSLFVIVTLSFVTFISNIYSFCIYLISFSILHYSIYLQIVKITHKKE